MKLLIADTQYPKGHYNLNIHLLKLLSSLDFIEEVKVLNYKEYYRDIEKEKFKLLKLKCLFFSKNEYWGYILSFLNAIIIKMRLLCIKYDKVIFFTFDTLSFFLISIFTNKNIYLFHHNNADHLVNKYKSIFFNLYKNKVYHIVFEDFIKDYLVKKGVDSNLVYVIRHPLPVLLNTCQPLSNKKSKIFVGLGHGNDESLLCEIINKELETKILQNNNIKLVIRSQQKYIKLPPSVKIINDFLSKEEYENLYSEASGILILFPYSFKYRFSGTLLDAFYSKKIVIGRNIPIVKSFSQMYPNSCYIFDKVNVLFNLLLDKSEFDNDEYQIFLANYSDNNIQNQLNEVLFKG